MLEDKLKGVQVVATICLQYGDTGKGKISDWLAEWADLNARGTGANNAGHTIFINGVEVVYHSLPVGITYDSLGKITVLGQGMAIDPRELCIELDDLVARGGTHNNLRIDEDAGVIMPWHISTDIRRNKSQSNGGIGSTGKGVGPCYADKVARIGLTMRDILSSDAISKKLHKIREAYQDQHIVTDEIVESLNPLAQRLKQYITNTTRIVHESIRQGKKIHLEGAQGTLLSVQHGISPYVTSSDCAINGTAAGVGISAGAVDLVLGLIKAPFMSRVGAGPFATELGGRDSEVYCAETEIDGFPTHSKIAELRDYKINYIMDGKKVVYDRKDSKIIDLMNSSNPFIQGVGIRLAAGEFGATTQRPRRVGWTDAVAALYSININRPLEIVITKPDSVAGLKEFKICYGYKYGMGKETTEFSRNLDFQRSIVPIYRSYEGYDSIDEAESFDRFPLSLKAAFKDLENFTKSKISIVSVGPEKHQTIVI